MDENGQHGKHERSIKILIVDDHAIIRQGLARLIEAEGDLAVCAEAENAGEAMQALDHLQIDLAIIDISLEGGKGLDLTVEIKSLFPTIAVLILSMYEGLLYAQRALSAGAAGYIAKYEAPEKIISAIHQILGGRVYVSNGKTSRVNHGATSVVNIDVSKNKINEVSPYPSSLDDIPNYL